MSEDPPIQVRKFSYRIPVSCCMMTDSTGANYCNHPAPPPVSKWRRLRWRLQDWWWRNRLTIHRGPCEVEE